MKLFSRHKMQISSASHSGLEQARARLFLVMMFFVVAYVIVVARAAEVSLIQGASYSQNELGEENDYAYSMEEEEQNLRSDIVDRNNVVLARSIKTSSLFADAKYVLEPVKTAKELKKIFPDISYGATLKKLQSKKRFVWIKRNITPAQQEQILFLGHPALNFKEEMNRIYPQGALAVHLVGASGIDGQGLAGMEGSFNKLLYDGKAPLELSLDVRLQHVVKREIESSIKKFNAKAGAGIIMNVNTGEILAAVSLPDYKPYDFGETKDNNKFNRFSLGVYELGSAFKMFSTAAVIEKNGGNIAQRFDVREPLKVGRHKIRDYHPEKRILSLPEVFIHSSNIGSAMMGQAVGTEGLKNFYKDLGLLESSEFELSEIGKPLVPNPWREVDTLTASFGHGIAVTPLQLVSAASAMVNGGIAVKPTILKTPTAYKNSKENVRVISPETSHRMRQLLRLVVTEGTGGKADVDGYLVGGKTGTAEKAGVGGYNRKKLISSFLGVFPMNNPEYAVFVMVDEPVGTKETWGYATGGWVGAPAVKNIIASTVSILGIPPVETKERFEGSLIRHIKTKEQIKAIKEAQRIASH